VLIANILGYLLQGHLRGVSLPDNSDMVNNHFVDDPLLSVQPYHDSPIRWLVLEVVCQCFVRPLQRLLVIIRQITSWLVLMSPFHGFQQEGIFFILVLMFDILASCLLCVFPQLPCGISV
jgi:hypothetical protein